VARRVAWCGLLALLPAALAAQAAPAVPTPRPNTLTLFGSVGAVHNVSTFDVEPTGLSRNGLAGGLRLMWQPGYRLAAGIELGHTHVYSVKRTLASGTTYEQTLDAWPLLFVFSMSPARGLHVNVGTGPSRSNGSVTAGGSSNSSSAPGAAYMVSTMYLVPVSAKLALGGELRFLRLAKYEDNNLSLMITAAWTLRSR